MNISTQPPENSDAPFLWGTASGAMAGVLTHEIARSYIKKPSMGKSIATITGSVLAGLGSGYVTMQSLKPKPKDHQPFSQLANYQEFQGVSTQAPESAQQFFHYADQVAKQGKHGAIQSVLQELYNKGLAEEATLLHNYLATHQQEPFVQAMDSWLTTLAERSPETLQHVQRQSVLMGLIAHQSFRHLEPQARGLAVTRAMLAGLAHDVGKLAIDPNLLHKATRIDTSILETFLAHYEHNVPDYPEKQAHLQFLRMVNGGRIAFGKVQATPENLLSVNEVIDIVTRKPLLGEPEFADDALKASNQAIYNDIKARAEASGMGFMSPEMEADLLNHGRRGTLTKEEGMTMASHDNLGMGMLHHIPFPADLQLSADVVNMDKQFDDSHLPEDVKQLRHLVKLTDVFEAVTGQRAYNRENGKNLTPGEAFEVLEADAARGNMNADLLAQFKTSGIAKTYADLYPDIPQYRDINHPQKAISAKNAAELGTVQQAQTRATAV